MKKVNLLVFLTVISAIVVGCAKSDTKDRPLPSLQPAPVIDENIGQATLPAESSFEGLIFNTERSAAGDLVAQPIGVSEDNYYLSGGPAVELQGNLYHTVHLFYGDHNAINALVEHDPSTDEVHVKWSDTLSNSANRWNNAFMSSYTMLIPLDEERLLFLESELTEEAGQYHLSAYNTVTETVEQLRENFWPLTDTYDYIYKFEWNADDQKLFMQSFLGNVWMFDLQTGADDVHLLKYRVIPHSTSGAPSLFLSPTFQRFAHDDESGQLTFYNNQGTALNTVSLPPEHYVPSEKIKWNPAGTIVWMEQSEVGKHRILDIDIDYLKIAPQHISFYNPDGLPIGAIQADSGREGAALEVAGWMDEYVAVIKSYRVAVDDESVSYYLYDVKNKRKGAVLETMPDGATATLPTERIVVGFKEITYLKEPVDDESASS